MKRFLIVALLSVAVFGPVLPAQSAADDDKRPQRCREEIEEICPGRFGFDKGKCMKEHIGDFSKECREVAKRRWPPKCLDRAKVVCPGMKPGDGGFGQCMQQNGGSICGNALASWYAVSVDWKSKAQEACADDNDKCPGVSHGFSGWWICLKKNEVRLSSSCKAFMNTDRETD